MLTPAALAISEDVLALLAPRSFGWIAGGTQCETSAASRPSPTTATVGGSLAGGSEGTPDPIVLMVRSACPKLCALAGGAACRSVSGMP